MPIGAMPQPNESRETLRFGRFVLDPGRRVLVERETEVHLGNRALDILLLLVQRAGEFVSNEEIIAHVWPRTIVVQENLRVHVAALRKALGDGRDGVRYIVNVPNRGYQFKAEVTREVGGLAAPSAVLEGAKGALPARLHRIIGREFAIQSLSAQVRQRRLVTLVGAGGIGKTTVAVAVASSFRDPRSGSPWSTIHFIDFSSLADARLVPNALAASLRLLVGDDAIPSLIAYLHDKSALILLDTCEHVAAAVAATAEALLAGAPHVHILATSREPLRAEGEYIQRLQTLDLPQDARLATVEEAMQFGAIELFVERASASSANFEFREADVHDVVEICRRLDGIPLGIELAAARVESLGTRAVAAALLESFSLLSKGRRTALPRQQTLEATLSWSFGLLTQKEQVLLLRLSVFAGEFSLDAAGEVAGWGDLTAAAVLDGIADLVSKSLIAADVTEEDARFRLFDTMRAYAAARLASRPDAPGMRRRHADHCLSFLRAAERDWTSTPVVAWRGRYGYRINDVRTALEWCFSPGGDIRLGVAITAKAAPLFFEMSFANEQLALTKRALDALGSLVPGDLQIEFELNILYAQVLVYTRGLHRESEEALARVWEIAQETGDPAQLQLALSSNWLGAYFRHEPALVQKLAHDFHELTKDVVDPSVQLSHDRIWCATLHLGGDQKGARICCERGLATKTAFRSPFLSVQLNRRVAIGNVLTRTLWLLGLPLQANWAALEAMDVAVREGEGINLAACLCAAAFPLAIWGGWFDAAEQRLKVALRHTAEQSIFGWRKFALAYEAFLNWRKSGAVGAPPAPDRMWRDGSPPQLWELLATLHSSYADKTMLKRGEEGKANWCLAELLRAQGERLLAADSRKAEALLLRSLQIAADAETLAWELRTSVTIGRLWHQTGRSRAAYDQLESVLTRVKEGFSCPDFRAGVSLYELIATSVGAYPAHFPDADSSPVLALPESIASPI